MKFFLVVLIGMSLFFSSTVHGQNLKVMTYNIRFGKGLDNRVDMDRLAGVIRVQGPDIILLNEVDVGNRRSGRVNQVQYLADVLGYKYSYYAPTLPSGIWRHLSSRRYGNLLLSRYPMTDVQTYTLPGTAEPRNLIVAKIQVSAQPIWILGTHLGLNSQERLAQVNFILEKAQDLSEPTIILGDFNAPPDAREIWTLTRHFTDGHVLAGRGTGYSFPAWDPRARIDYIFFSDSLVPYVQTVQTIFSPASDHFPVMGHFHLKL